MARRNYRRGRRRPRFVGAGPDWLAWMRELLDYDRSRREWSRWSE